MQVTKGMSYHVTMTPGEYQELLQVIRDWRHTAIDGDDPAEPATRERLATWGRLAKGFRGDLTDNM